MAANLQAISHKLKPQFRGLQRIEQCYQAVTNVEDDVDSVQTVADVLPEWSNHHHWLSVCPGQVIVVVTWKNILHQSQKSP